MARKSRRTTPLHATPTKLRKMRAARARRGGTTRTAASLTGDPRQCLVELQNCQAHAEEEYGIMTAACEGLPEPEKSGCLANASAAYAFNLESCLLAYEICLES